MKRFGPLILLPLCLCFILSACKNSNAPHTTDAAETGSTIVADNQREAISNTLYFETDEAVDKFFADYNTLAEISIPTDKIEKGNIKTKALVYIDDLNLEVVHANEFLSISMSASVENESTKLYAIFRDAIKTLKSNISDDTILSAWDKIHETGYLVKDYDCDGIGITYIPSQSPSQDTVRIDLTFPN